ncbi:ankyrin [Ascobolus immersus RN42]|uniref:Ankyrin n=1 Tax=Ascobolus immersus RN42 TaxID=1160509 RepID=A0A3N4I4A1_ASCIM|nr:ankyrin [Ascobolus immersus RN42]
MVNGDWWDDFTENLSTDLAPLIALFGENPTKQYLSECVNFTDVFIFAMAPLGILTAIVSAIRVAGTAGLRAFIGRAKEGGGQAEAELCSSTSREVCELYNNGGIARVFGRPKLLEIVHDRRATNADFYPTEDNPKATPKAGLYTFQEYMEYLKETEGSNEDAEWTEGGVQSQIHKQGASPDTEHNKPIKEGPAFAPNPNLSLNVGIKQRPKWVFTTAAMFGLLIQSFVVVWAILTRYVLDGFVRSSSEDKYAVPMTVIGTFMLCFGNGYCAWLIERTTKERVFYRKKTGPTLKPRSRIYWIQPGIQYIGDQAFDSFLYSDINNSLHSYMTSWKDNRKFHPAHIWIAIICSALGFILQFLGMRACHSSVIMAQLGATIVMSIIRAILRTDRLSTEDNVMGDNPDGYKGHELDWLALNLDDKGAFSRGNEKDRTGKLLNIVTAQQILNDKSSEKGTKSKQSGDTLSSSVRLDDWTPRVFYSGTDANDWRQTIQSSPLDEHHPHEVAMVFLHRKRLAEVTRRERWEDDDLVSVRQLANNLGDAIESTLQAVLNNDFQFREDVEWRDAAQILWNLPCSLLKSISPSPTSEGSIILSVKRNTSADGFIEGDWEADRCELESILGLWVWSIKCSRAFKDDVNFKRLLSFGSASDSGSQALLDFKLWCQGGNTRINEIQSKNITSDHTRFFGLQNLPALNSGVSCSRSALCITSRGSLEMNCAQELYALFFRSLMGLVVDVGGETTVKGENRNFHLSNSNIAQIQKAFTDTCLGSTDDAFTCVFPTLRLQHKMPSVQTAINGSRIVAERYIKEKRWKDAEQLLLWGIRQLSIPESRQDTVVLSIEDEPLKENTHESAFQSINLWRLLMLELCECYRAAALEPHDTDRRMGCGGLLSLLDDGLFQTASTVQLVFRGQACATSREDEHPTLTLAETVIRYCEFVMLLAKEYDYRDIVDKIELQSKERESLVEDLSVDADSGIIAALESYDLAATLYHLGKLHPKEHKITSPALLLACRNGWYAVVKKLIEMSAILEHKEKERRTPLSYAAEYGDLNTLNYLLEKGANPSSADSNRVTPLVHAVGAGRLGVITRLARDPRVDLEARDADGSSLAMKALKLGHEAIFRALVDTQRVDLESSSFGNSLLATATKLGDTNTMSYLLDSGVAELEFRAETALLCDLAVESGSIEALQVILDTGIRIQCRLEAQNAFHSAICAGQLQIVQLFLSEPGLIDPTQPGPFETGRVCSDPNLPASDGEPVVTGTLGELAVLVQPLAVAIARQDSAMVKLLLEHEGVHQTVVENSPYRFRHINSPPQKGEEGIAPNHSADGPTDFLCHATLKASRSKDPSLAGFEILQLLRSAVDGLNGQWVINSDACGRSPLEKAIFYNNPKLTQLLLDIFGDSFRSHPGSLAKILPWPQECDYSTKLCMTTSDFDGFRVPATVYSYSWSLIRSPFWLAYFHPDREENLNLLRVLVESGHIDFNQRNDAFPVEYVFLQAVEAKDIFLVDLFLKADDIDRNVTTARGCNAIHLAVENTGRGFKDTDCTLLTNLLQAGVDPDRQDSEGITPLRATMERHLYRSFELLLNTRRVDINVRTEHGGTPLHFAAYFLTNTDLISELVEAGLDPNQNARFQVDSRLGYFEGTAVNWAFQNCNLVVARFLLSPPYNAKFDPAEAYRSAAKRLGVECFRFLIERGEDPKDAKPLNMVVSELDNWRKARLQWRMLQIIRLLLRFKKVEIDLRDHDRDGHTALYVTVWHAWLNNYSYSRQDSPNDPDPRR